MTDITPAVAFDLAPAPLAWTAMRVRDLFLAFPGDDLELAEVVGLGIVDVIEDRDALRAALRAACAELHTQNAEIARLRARHVAAIEDARALRARRREAA